MGDLKPVPVPDEFSAGFWAAAEEGKLAFQTCSACGTKAHPPVLHCQKCLTSGFTFEPEEGPFVLRSWTVAHYSFLSGFADEVPYTMGVASPKKHPQIRLLARLEGGAETEPRIGDILTVGFSRSEDGPALPVLVPAEAAE